MGDRTRTRNRLDALVAVLDVLAEMPWEDTNAVLDAIALLRSHHALRGILESHHDEPARDFKAVRP